MHQVVKNELWGGEHTGRTRKEAEEVVINQLYFRGVYDFLPKNNLKKKGAEVHLWNYQLDQQDNGRASHRAQIRNRSSFTKGQNGPGFSRGLKVPCYFLLIIVHFTKSASLASSPGKLSDCESLARGGRYFRRNF